MLRAYGTCLFEMSLYKIRQHIEVRCQLGSIHIKRLGVFVILRLGTRVSAWKEQEIEKSP